MLHLFTNLLRNFPERQNLVTRRLLHLVDPAAVVIDSVAATTGNVEVGSSIVGQLIAGSVPGCGHENGAVKFTVAAAISVESSCAVADDQDDSIPAGVTVIVEVTGHNEDAVSGVRAQVKT